MDPPYREQPLEQILAALQKHDVLEEDAVIIAEHEDPIVIPEGFILQKERRYGRAHITFVQKEER